MKFDRPYVLYPRKHLEINPKVLEGNRRIDTPENESEMCVARMPQPLDQAPELDAKDDRVHRLRHKMT